MKVSLISTTQSHIDGLDLTTEQLIVYTARVSNPGNQMNTETADRLIAYLIKNKHWSPFEMADMTVEIVTSRGIAQQILRHRSFSFQEFSQRYAEVTEMEPIQLRKAGATNRQSSTDIMDLSDWVNYTDQQTGIALNYPISALLADHLEYSQVLYRALLQYGVAKECARFVLPITTQSTIYMKGSVRSWIHYLQIRCDQHTQLEHRLVAEAIRDIFKEQFPNIAKALEL